jgi:acyl-coenzyme A thioesterase PaaI-like protein
MTIAAHADELPSALSGEILISLGWKPYIGGSPFSAPHGQMYQKIGPDGVCWRAFRAGRAHCNSAGIVHGGMMVSFMDALMGLAVANGTQSRALTMRLTADFLSIVRPGNWVVGQGRVIRATRTIVFVEGAAHAGKRPVLIAQGIFKRMQARPRRTG